MIENGSNLLCENNVSAKPLCFDYTEKIQVLREISDNLKVIANLIETQSESCKNCGVSYDVKNDYDVSELIENSKLLANNAGIELDINLEKLI